jgi:hypothetical protein
MQRPEWQYKGMVDCLVRVYKEEGFLAFWKGTHAVFWRNSVCMLGMVGFYNTVDRCLPQGIPFRALATGSLCGVIGSFMSYPFEMLRAARQHNVSFYEEMFMQGWKRMLAGYVPGAIRIVMHSAALGIIIPRMKSMAGGVDYFKEGAGKITKTVETISDKVKGDKQ